MLLLPLNLVQSPAGPDYPIEVCNLVATSRRGASSRQWLVTVAHVAHADLPPVVTLFAPGLGLLVASRLRYLLKLGQRDNPARRTAIGLPGWQKSNGLVGAPELTVSHSALSRVTGLAEKAKVAGTVGSSMLDGVLMVNMHVGDPELHSALHALALLIVVQGLLDELWNRLPSPG